MSMIESPSSQFGEESIWFKLSPLLKDPTNPMGMLMQMSERYGPIIPVNMARQRVVFISEPEYFKHVLVTKTDNYVKYFDGLIPIFGKSMITLDGALWQKIRMPQQAAFHPDMFAEYIPYFNQAIRAKLQRWADLAKTGEEIEQFKTVEKDQRLIHMVCAPALFYVIFKLRTGAVVGSVA